MTKYRMFSLTLFSALLINLILATQALASLPNKPIQTQPSIFSENADWSLVQDKILASKTPNKTAYELGLKHLRGFGVRKDIELAIQLIEHAADSGYTDAKLFLGLMHYTNVDIPIDYDKARAWFTQAAAQDNGYAQLFLGRMYFFGRGVEKDYLKAAHWFHKAAQQRISKAEYSLGVMHAGGLGLAQDVDQAMFWFRRAAQDDNAQAKQRFESIEQRIEGLSKEKIQENYQFQAYVSEVSRTL